MKTKTAPTPTSHPAPAPWAKDVLTSPTEHPLFGSMRPIQHDRLSFYLRLAAEGRQATLIHFGPFRGYIFNQPEMAQAILVEHDADFYKGLPLHRALEPVIGDGLFISEGGFHRKQRKLMAPAFTARRVAEYADTIVRYATAIQAGWRDRAAVRADRAMTALTMSIIGKTLFDAEVLEETDELGAAITTTLQFMNYMISHIFPLPLSVPTPRNRRTRAALDLVKNRLQAMIDERRRSSVGRNDFLSILLGTRDENGEGMDDTQVREEAMTLFLAGHETTANTLSWCIYFLATHPEVAERLAAEVDQALGGRPPTAADLPNLSYALQVFKEALRLYPPADAVTRMALHDVTVGPYRFKKNEIIDIAIYTIHRRPDFFPDPERFDPDRFTPENEKHLPRYAFMPFGAGPRVCIGNHFAMMEGQLILAVLAQHARFDLVPGQEVVPFPVFAVRQKHGCRVIVRRRAT